MSDLFTFEELMAFSDSRLERIEDDLQKEVVKKDQKKLQQIGKILWLQDKVGGDE